MSANLVGIAHIDTLLSAGLMLDRCYGPMAWADSATHARTLHTVDGHRHRHELSPATADRVGQMLDDTNVASVNHLYNDATTEHATYRYRRDTRFLDAISVLKAIDCYIYQACEIPTWDDCEALQFCEALRRRAIGNLPGYDSATTWPVPARNN